MVVHQQRLERRAAGDARQHQSAAGHGFVHGNVLRDTAVAQLTGQPVRCVQLVARRVSGVELNVAAQGRHRIAAD